MIQPANNPLRVVLVGGTMEERQKARAQLGAMAEPLRVVSDGQDASAEIFVKVFADNPVATIRVDWTELAVLESNAAFAELSGYEAAAVLGRPLSELGFTLDGLPAHDVLRRLGSGESMRRVVVSFRKRNGDLCHATGYFSRLAAGAADCVLGMLVDESERDRAANEIRKLATFPELNPNPVLEFGADGQLTYFNRAAIALAESVGFRTVEELLPPQHVGIVGECLATQRPRLRMETRNGTRTLSWSFYPIVPHNLVHCYLGDITDRLQLEAQMRQAQKMEAVGQLAGGIAHDFNNLLTIVQMQISMLRMRGVLGPEVAAGIDEISHAAERATNLTRQLLTFSRRQVKSARDIDVNELVSGMTKLLRRILGEDIVLESRFASGPACIHADPGMIEQVLMNLVVNSRDAMPRGGRLVIGLEVANLDAAAGRRHPQARPGRFVCLSVADTGTGIEPDDMTRIFEPFFTTKEVGKGTGLGLAIVYAVTRQHDGWVEVESAVGKGTRFAVYLPALDRPTGSAGQLRAAEMSVPGGRETILVVEDEAAVRSVARQVLARLGYNVLEADSAPAALRLWEELGSSVDLLFTDLVMPGGVTGHEMVQRLRGQRPDLKVLYCSGYDRESELLAPGEASRPDFLPKPYKAADLGHAVRRVLDRSGE
jgi:PAS domain S-box-containing protein